jgi:hypothetical protein
MAVTKEHCMRGARNPEHNMNQAALDFCEKVLEISGLGDQTYVPDGALHPAIPMQWPFCVGCIDQLPQVPCFLATLDYSLFSVSLHH